MAEHPILFKAEMVRAILSGQKTLTRRSQPMAEHPILFKAEMVRAILSGQKTLTRRVVTGLGVFVNTELSLGPPSVETDGVTWVWPDGTTKRCRYGQPGHTLWVREAWQQTRPRKSDGQRFVLRQPQRGCGDLHYAADAENDPPPKWRPSIHMPRWACRIELKVLSVRVEQVQEISEEDALAEGLFQRCGDVHPGLTEYSAGDGFWTTKPRTAFCRVWDSINAKRGYSWESNPWVWVVEFKRLKP